MTNKRFWLYRRLEEVGRTRQELAEALGVSVNRLSEMEKQRWKLRIEHINPTAKILNFDKSALVDFISGEISEEQLWQKKPITITEQDIAILQAVKSVAGLQKQTESNTDTPKQDKLLQKNTSR